MLWTRLKDKQAVEQLRTKLMLDIYFEFVRNARSQESWEAGMITINQIGGNCAIRRGQVEQRGRGEVQ